MVFGMAAVVDLWEAEPDRKGRGKRWDYVRVVRPTVPHAVGLDAVLD